MEPVDLARGRRLKILYVQSIEIDQDLCRTSRLGLSHALANLGCTVTLVAGYRRARPEPPRGVDLIAIPLLGVPYLRALLYSAMTHATVCFLLLTRPFDVAIVDPYTFHSGWPFDWLSRVGLKRTRFVLDVRSGIFHTRTRAAADRLRKLLIRIAFGYARRVFSAVTTISPMLRDILAAEYGFRKDRIGIWESGVASDFRTAGTRSDALPSIPSDRFVVLYHGSFGPDRGLDETIDAMRLLEGRRSDILLIMLGGGTEEPRLRERAVRLGNVLFVRTVPHDQVAQFIERCDVGILPLRPTPVMRSSRPLKLLEYLALAKPVIVSRIEAFTTVLDGDPGAIYLRDHTPAAIADAIELACDNREQRTALARVSHPKVARQYTWQHQAETLCQFLATLP